MQDSSGAMSNASVDTSWSAKALPCLGPVLRRRTNPGTLCEIGSAAASVLESYERVIRSKKSEAVLVWPQRPDSVAVFHALAALSRLQESDRRGLATLFFPWSRNTAGIQRTLLVDRAFIDRATLPALNRVMKERASHPVFGYLMALHSLRHILNGKKQSKRFADAVKRDPGLLHPSLFEILPQGGIGSDGVLSYEGQFLRRLRRHTWISERREHMEAATDPIRTPFFLFGVHPEEARLKVLRSAGVDSSHGGRVPDVVLVDLTRRARQRLQQWKVALPGFLGILGDLYGGESPPVLAITDDAFVIQTLRWDVIKRYEIRRGAGGTDRTPVAAEVILSRSPDVLDQGTISAATAPAIIVEAYGTDILQVVEAGLKLRKSLLNVGQSEIADAVTAAIGVAQALVGLPGTPAQLYEFLTSEYEGYDRQTFGARFDHQAPLGKMRSVLERGLAGVHHGGLSKFRESFETLCNATSNDTPGRKLFDEWLCRLMQSGGRAMVLCSSEFLRGFVVWRIENDPDLASMQSYLGNKLWLVDRREAIESLSTIQGEQERLDRILFVEPRADDLLHVLIADGLPREVLVLSNLANIEQALRRVRILLSLPGIDAAKPVLVAIQEEFESALAGRSSEIPDLDAEMPLPRLGTLDLTVGGAPASGARRLIGTSSGVQIRAFDGSEVAVYDPDALLPFRKELAKDLAPGDQVCVFSPDFVAAARERLNLSADAPEVLALYHKVVAEKASLLPGTDTSSRVSALRRRMLEIDPALDLPGDQAMRHWIDVADLLDMPRDKVRPQAPRSRRHFLCFMSALGISEEVAGQYWDWGIFWTRSIRIRSGSSFHQVFMSVLIDPHGTASRLPAKRQQEVWRIHETAEQHVVSVVSNDVEMDQ